MVNWIISSSILALVVIVLRTIFNGKIDPRIQYALWMVVLVRLLLPFNFAVSEFSFLRTVETKTAEPVTIPTQAINRFEPQAAPAYRQEDINVQDSQFFKTAEFAVVKTGTSAQNTVCTEDLLKTVAFGGTAVMVLVFLVSNVRFYLKLRRMRRLLTRGKPNVYLVSELSSSCLFGASIYIREADVVDKKKAECIIAHERAHYKHLDHIWSVLRMAALCLHWYNPIVWIAVRLSKRDSELASDFSTVQKLGEERRIEYGEILLSMFTAKHFERNAFSCATTMNSGKKGIKERIKMITKKPRIISIALAVVMIVMTVASCGTFTSPKETAGEESLSHQTQHIEKQISDNLSINADVENNVKNLNSYNARLYTVENDFLQNVFLKDREIVESTNGDGTFELFATENDDRVVNYHAKGFTEEFVFETQKVLDRELQYFFYAHGGVHLDRDNRFKVKELDFMSSADAVAIAKDYMQQIGISAADYKVYSFDVEYLQGVMDKEIEISTAAGITLEELAEMGPLEYTKDDEFYLVVPDLTLPDGSKLTEVSTTVSTSCAAYELTSDQVYMIVDNNGLALFKGKGIYSVVSTRETGLNIISAEEALDKILPRYNGIKNTVKITRGELAYVPQIENIEEGTYVLKPAWVFDVTETESGVPEEYATRYRRDAVDAVTGEMIEIDRNGY